MTQSPKPTSEQELEPDQLLQDKERFQGDYTVFTFRFNGVPVKFVALADAQQALSTQRQQVIDEMAKVTDQIRKDYPIKSADYFEEGTQEKKLCKKYDEAWDKALETVDDYFEEIIEAISQKE